MDTKACAKCGIDKPRADFWKDRKARDGLRHLCKQCGREANVKHYDAHRDEEIERNARWHVANRRVATARHRERHDALTAWVVYRLDFTDGRFYFGSTGHYEDRLDVHKVAMRSGVHRNPRIRAAGYGPDDFRASIVTACADEVEARLMEARLIDESIGGDMCLNRFRGYVTKRAMQQAQSRLLDMERSA